MNGEGMFNVLTETQIDILDEARTAWANAFNQFGCESNVTDDIEANALIAIEKTDAETVKKYRTNITRYIIGQKWTSDKEQPVELEEEE